MKNFINNKSTLLKTKLFRAHLKKVVVAITLLTAIISTSTAQVNTYSKPSLWMGAAAGANFNFYRGSTQMINANAMSPVPFQKGFGIGLFAAPLIEFYRPGSMFGFMFQAGYDGRNGKFDQITSPCNCPRDLKSNLSYITIEPNLRFAPFRSNFYLFGGPRFAYNINKSFVYKQGTNPDYVEQVAEADIKGDMSHMNNTLISMQVGAGYDMSISKAERRTQYVLSPFVSFQPYYGQDPRSIETWNITTLRVGAALKIGRGKIIPIEQPEVLEPKIVLSVSTPVNIPVVKKMIETFPLRNYIFFDLESTEISDRYVLITRSQVKDFKEDQLEDFSPKKPSARSARQMKIYYNVINILGDRMGKNPTATINLVGSSEKGPDDGKLMAQSVKDYLVSVFGISAARITTEGLYKPKLPSEKIDATESLDLLRQGDRRVSVESNSSNLLMEFQSGNAAPLKPIEIVTINAKIDSVFSCNIGGTNCTSWSLEAKDESGKVVNFGPYYEPLVTIPNSMILGSRSEGDYKLTMIGKTKSGRIIKTDTTVHLVKWVAPKVEEIMRFSILYEFDDAKAIYLYDKYLTEIVAPKIPRNGIVIINGYTDIIGLEEYNKKLSFSRANDVKTILENALLKVGRTDVTFEVDGNGEDENLAPFENIYPEERFYNRTVIIDIMKSK